MRKAFQQRGFGRLFAGLTTSMFGDSVMLLVLSMWVKTLTGSNGEAGLTFFRPDSPLPTPPVEPSRLIDPRTPPSEACVSEVS